MRKQFAFLFLFSLLGVSQALAGETVKISEELSGYLALPPFDFYGPPPAILLIHEWWGLNDQIKTVANELANNGFAALAIDLYRSRATGDPTEAHELMRGLPDDRALADMKAAVDYLQSRRDVTSDRIGVIGWCMGGGFALQLAVNDPRIKVVAVYYGKLITDEKTLANLKAPLLGIFGEEDRGIPAESVKQFEAKLEALGKRVEIHLYPNAGHAFANPNNKEGYRPEAAKDAWQKTLTFFKANLA